MMDFFLKKHKSFAFLQCNVFHGKLASTATKRKGVSGSYAVCTQSHYKEIFTQIEVSITNGNGIDVHTFFLVLLFFLEWGKKIFCGKRKVKQKTMFCFVFVTKK